jgi:hypothetical protein
MEGNPSVLDDVNAEGPPVLGLGTACVLRGVNYWEQERAAAVEADLSRDVCSDFDDAADRENQMWDALAGGDPDSDGVAARDSARAQPPEPEDFNGA